MRRHVTDMNLNIYVINMSNAPKVIYKANVTTIPTGLFNITLQAHLKIQIIKQRVKDSQENVEQN